VIDKRSDLGSVARLSSRVIVILYAIIKQLLYMTDANILPAYWLHRAAVSSVMVILIFIVTDKRFSGRTSAALVGFALALPEIILAVFIPPAGGRHDILGIAGLIMINVLIFSICNYIAGTFARAKRTEIIFDLLMDSTSEYMVIINEMSNVEYISQSLAEWFGISQREYAIKRPLLDLCRTSEMAGMFQEVMESERTVNESQHELTIGDVKHYFLSYSSLMLMENGEYVRTIELSDITPIMEAKNEAVEASLGKSKFLATMSHEIRTPLNAIIGIAQIHLQQKNLPKEYIEGIEKIFNAGKNLLGIINDILDMSKVETGKLELNIAEYGIPSLIHDAVQLNVVRIGYKPIHFVLDVDENVPLRLLGDELRLKQILNNLLSNAIKYTDEGFVRLTVKTKESIDDVNLIFTVEDSGQGMKEADIKKLFSEYLRFNIEANRQNEGTGLGLSITRRLIEMMDGRIEVKSEFGIGSIFTATVKQKVEEYLPIGAELADQLRNFKFLGQKENLQISHMPMPYGNVLVVDDVATNLYVAEGLLSPYKLKIETAESGFAALRKINNGKTYDIIFMDHMMPQMDGIETTKRLRELDYKGTIVALTANALVGNEEMFIKNGFDGFLPKPIDIRHLNALLNKFIRDRYPDEAKKYAPQTITKTHKVNKKVLKIFCADAQKAIITLQKSFADGDIKLFTITVHAMKSALANVGEPGASSRAEALEKAGLTADTSFISGNLEEFVKTLEELVKKNTPAETAEENLNISEDKEYLAEQLQIIKTACENYDAKTAYAAIERLKEKPWQKETTVTLEKIHDALFIYSDFDEAAEMAGKLK